MVKKDPTISESIDSYTTEITESVNSADVSVPDESSHSMRDFLINLAIIVSLSAMTAFFVQRLMLSMLGPAISTPALLMIDAERLAREEIDVLGDLVATNKLSSEVMPERSRQFSEGLLREIQAYVERGHVVLRSTAVLAAPAEVRDITSEVREQLLQKGLMDRKPDAP